MLLLTFTAGPNRYAVQAARVVEIIPKVKLHPIPRAPVCLVGLLGYRGNAIPVVDLCMLLDVAPCRDCLSTRIIVVNDAPDDQNGVDRIRNSASDDSNRVWLDRRRDAVLLGLLTEHVGDLLSVRPEQVVPAPVHLPPVPYLDAIVHTDQEIVQLIAVAKLRGTTLQSSCLGQDAALNLKSNPEGLTDANLETPS
jgi:chemotaxis-related protein WspB